MVEEIVTEVKKELENHNDVIVGQYKFSNTYIGNVYMRMEIVTATLHHDNIRFTYNVTRKPIDNETDLDQSIRSYNVWVDYTTFKD